MMGGSRVFVVIVNWNGRDLTAAAVDSLRRETFPPLDIIIIDNASKDCSADYLEGKYPDIRIIRNHKNLGFAEGNNQGIAEALKSGAEYIFFLNNDAEVDAGAIPRLIQVLQDHPNVGAVAPFIVYADNPDLIWYGGGKVSLWRGLVAHKRIRRRIRPDERLQEKTDYITGCAMMVRAAILKAIGGFDASFILYSEDVDLSLRIRDAGWSLRVTSDAIVRHHISASTGGALSPFKIYHRARSLFRLLKRWAPWWSWAILFCFGLAGGLLYSIRFLLSGRYSAIGALWRGLLDGVFNISVPVRYRLAS